MKARYGLALLAALVAAPATAHAQQHSWPISSGDHVRVYSAGGDTVRAEGVVARLALDTVVLSVGGTIHQSIPLRPNDLFGVRRPRSPGSAARQKSLWGGFLGASIGGIAAPFVANAVESPMSTGATVGVGVAAGGLVGAGLGAVMGWVMPGYRWERFRVGTE